MISPPFISYKGSCGSANFPLYFNMRHSALKLLNPRGLKRGYRDYDHQKPYFNPLNPRGLRRWQKRPMLWKNSFQSTQPSRVETTEWVMQILRPRYFNPLNPRGLRHKLQLFSQRYYQPSAFSLDLSATCSHHATIMVIPVRILGTKDPGISCSLAFRTKLNAKALVKPFPSAPESDRHH